MTRARIRVIKVGGSLFQCDRLPGLLTAWLAQASDNRTGDADQGQPRIDILVAGGGAIVDQVRLLDQRFALDSETSHWMSVGAMSCTSRLLAELLELGQPISRWEDLLAVVAGGCSRPVIFDVQQWLAEFEAGQPGVPLARDWRATSDSIAARLAGVLSADELVLLKSTGIAAGIGWSKAAEQGLVDEFFPRVAAGARQIDWVNLRSFASRSG